jgi:hypothetical protein
MFFQKVDAYFPELDPHYEVDSDQF